MCARISPIQRISEILSLNIELKDGPLTVCGSIIAASMFLQKRIKTILSRVFFAAHKHHWREQVKHLIIRGRND